MSIIAINEAAEKYLTDVLAPSGIIARWRRANESEMIRGAMIDRDGVYIVTQLFPPIDSWRHQTYSEVCRYWHVKVTGIFQDERGVWFVTLDRFVGRYIVGVHSSNKSSNVIESNKQGIRNYVTLLFDNLYQGNDLTPLTYDLEPHMADLSERLQVDML